MSTREVWGTILSKTGLHFLSKNFEPLLSLVSLMSSTTGIDSETIKLPAETTQEELLAQIDALNADPTVDGLLVQLPVPKHIGQ